MLTQTLQGALQAQIRSATGKTNQDFNGDLHDLCDIYALPAAPISGRIIGLAKKFDTSINSSSAAMNYLLANSSLVVGPAGLFATGAPGVWYDPSDASTLFSDTAGTTPSPTPGAGALSVVGKMLDKSGNGNHAISYNTTTARPELSARVNLLTYSEQFDNLVWTKSNVTITANSTTAPDGTTTADAMYETTANGEHRVSTTVTTSTTTYTYSSYVKPIGGRNFNLEIISTVGNGVYVVVNSTTGVVNASGVYGTGFTLVGTPTVTDAGNGWWRCSFTATVPATTVTAWVRAIDGASNSYAGDVNKGLFIWGADLRPANIGTSLPSYQRIADQYTYDSSGFPRYLKFDGIDDGMYTPASIPFATVTSDGQARRNLLTLPTEFNVTPPWTIAAGVTVTPNVDTAPDGTLSADRIVFTGVSQDVYQELTLANTQYVASYYVKAGSAGEIGKTIAIGIGNSTNGFTDQLITLTANWQRITATRNVNSGTTCRVGVHTYAGATALNVIVWGAQLETGSTATAFQNIGTDKATVFAGVRKISDATAAIICELSASAGANNGTLYFAGPTANATADFGFASKGTIIRIPTATSLAAPTSRVLTGIGDISGDIAQLRVNGAVGATDLGDQGTGNFGTYPLYIGSRNNGSLWFNGYLYSMIVVGAASTAAQISSTESWINVKEGGVY